MKIGPTHDLPAEALRGPAPARTSAPPAPAAPAGDRVELSAAGLQLAAGAAAPSADFDQAKVDAIRNAIREGRFTVDAGAIADQLIADAAALLARKAE